MRYWLLQHKKTLIISIIQWTSLPSPYLPLKEIKTCLPFLKEQIKAIKPDFICTLGETAAQTLLNTSKPLSILRGKFHNYNGIKLITTYHPSHLLKNPADKRPVWEDMKKIIKEYKYNK